MKNEGGSITQSGKNNVKMWECEDVKFRELGYSAFPHLHILTSPYFPELRSRMKDKKIVLFDGVCNLCNRSVQFIIKRDKKKQFLFASLQGETGQQLLRRFQLPVNDLHSFVLVENDKAYTRSAGALRVAKALGGGWKLLYGFIIIPKFIRDGVYNWIARNRYKWYGKREECMIPTPELKERFLD